MVTFALPFFISTGSSVIYFQYNLEIDYKFENYSLLLLYWFIINDNIKSIFYLSKGAVLHLQGCKYINSMKCSKTKYSPNLSNSNIQHHLLVLVVE